MVCSLKNIVLSGNSIIDIQSSPLIIKPDIIVDKDHVDALSDKASVLLSEFVFLIMKGSEQTLMSIIPNPHARNDSWINGIIMFFIDCMIIALVKGTSMDDSLKNGFNRLPFM